MWEETKQSKTHLSQAGDAAGKQGRPREGEGVGAAAAEDKS